MYLTNYNAVVWSKNNCVGCGSAKMLLGQHGIKIKELNIDETPSLKEDLLALYPGTRTVPVIEIYEDAAPVFIGNLTALKVFLDKIKETNVE